MSGGSNIPASHAYTWAKIENSYLTRNLPKSNLVLVTAKTPSRTVHPECPLKDFKVRLFNPEELAESGASLRRREIGLNHQELIKGAYVVDAQYNSGTQNLEAICFFPTPYINMMKKQESDGERVQFSVEYVFREAEITEEGALLSGICFDRVDLLMGLNGGDHFTSMKFVEADKKGFIEGELTSIPDNEEIIMSEDATKLKEAEEIKEKEGQIKTLTIALTEAQEKAGALEKEVETKENLVKTLTEEKTKIETDLKTKSEEYEKLDKEHKELDAVAVKAQENITKFAEEKENAILQAKKEAKLEVVSKIKEVLPETTFVNGPDKGARILADNVRERLKEMEDP